MIEKKLCTFSPCGELFVCVNDAGILTIWETASNNVKQELDVKMHLNTTCSSIIWGSFQLKSIGNEDVSNETQFLMIGTKAGDIYVYNYNVGKLYNYFSDGHNGNVNDMSLLHETNSFYSCSSDKSVIIWDTISGKVKQQWIADEVEITSICVVDSKNLLTGSTSIIWWNIEGQTIIKKFPVQEKPVALLKVVNSLDVSSSSYFLSTSLNASKITAWSLNEKNDHTTVATFVVNGETQNIDASKTFSKDNPLLLTAVTRGGNLVLFEHVLNGKTKNLTPIMTVEIQSKLYNNGGLFPKNIPIVSSKLLHCAESCIIAYGDDDNPIFESVNIFDCPEKLTLVRDCKIQEKVYDCFVPKVKICKKFKENAIANGKSSPDLSYNSPKRRKLLKKSAISESSSNTSLHNESIDDRMLLKSPPMVKKKFKTSKKLESSRSDIILPADPTEFTITLLRGIDEENSAIIKMVLQCDNLELIRASVKNLPLSRLNVILLELYRRLKVHEKRSSSSLLRWLKEILSHHLPNLITCDEDLKDTLNKISELIDIRYITQTLSKMRLLKGLLQVQMRNTSTEESEDSSSDSDIEELVDS